MTVTAAAPVATTGRARTRAIWALRLRHLVGTCEVLAVIGLLVPRLTWAAACGLVALMAGATVTNVFVLQVSPASTLALLVAAAVVARALRPRGAAR